MGYKTHGAWVLALVAGLAYWVSRGPEFAPPAPSRSQAHAVSAPSRGPARPSLLASQVGPVPGETVRPALTREEKTRYLVWMQGRGLDVGLDAQGREVRLSHAYESVDSAQLAALADRGDARAALVLAERLLASGPQGAGGLPERAVQDEAIHWLLRASELGYTTSLERLIDLHRLRAITGDESSRRGRDRLDPVALTQAYTYAFLIQKRGDINEAVQFDQLRAAGEISPHEMAQARNAAEQLYVQMTVHRAQFGLPAFEDGVPTDIEEIGARLAQEALSGQ